jgi:uncharacterized protein (DUF1800 family)
MAADLKLEASIALHRFGFGARSASIAEIASDPRGALLTEIEARGAGTIDRPDLMTSAQASRAGFLFRQERQARKLAMEQATAEAESMAAEKAPDMAVSAARRMPAPGSAPDMQDGGKRAAMPEPVDVQRKILLDEAKARYDAAVNARIGFAERLVWFWSNHFCVSADVVPNLAGGYEREAIRPHVLGRFADMLLAVESHPAMLVYLDNARSIGPKSVAGIIGRTGLNENLARETLELHTLGVRSVYTQDDVTTFAKVLTGWTLLPVATNPEHGAEFVFNPRLHEPGEQKILGKSYAQAGLEQGRAVLADLARHPATARHIAAKMAQHFAADVPPPALVERLRICFLETDGDLKAMARTLVDAPEMWTAPLTKIKRPSEWLIASLRITGLPPNAGLMMGAQAALGERLWRPPAPKGFADDQAAWLDGLAQRLDFAHRIAMRVADAADPQTMVDVALGPLASTETRQTVARAESRVQAFTLLLMSPEFQRR